MAERMTPMEYADKRRAFADEMDAEQDRATTIDGLCTEYQKWCDDEGLPSMSADELRLELLTRKDELPRQLAYVEEFLARWETAEELERDSRKAQQEWAAARIWCADFAVAGLDHALDSDDIKSGYAYPAGCYIKDTGDGQYWTIADRGDIAVTLAECEAFLWENHAKHELANG